MILDNNLQRKRQRISLTPLIDVVFILLLFFVLESNFIDLSELLVPLPEQESSASSTTVGRSVEIQLAENNTLWIAGESLSVSDLGALLQARRLAADTEVNLGSQSGVTLQVLVSVIDILKENGLHKIRLTALE